MIKKSTRFGVRDRFRSRISRSLYDSGILSEPVFPLCMTQVIILTTQFCCQHHTCRTCVKSAQGQTLSKCWYHSSQSIKNHEANQGVCPVAQSGLTLRDPMDCSPPGFSVHGILQARNWSRLPFFLQGIFLT